MSIIVRAVPPAEPSLADSEKFDLWMSCKSRAERRAWTAALAAKGVTTWSELREIMMAPPGTVDGLPYDPPMYPPAALALLRHPPCCARRRDSARARGHRSRRRSAASSRTSGEDPGPGEPPALPGVAGSPATAEASS